MAKSRSIDFKVQCPESLPAVDADADKIAQVLSNLVSNALKYTQAGGKVRLIGERSSNEVLICVSDTGPGIPRDKWDQIFDRFARLPASYAHQISGVGLGLYIVRQIIDRHNGRLWLDSEVGRGSDFYVSLPIGSSKGNPQTEAEPAKRVATVLLCDPDPELAEKIRLVLRRANYDVHVAHSGLRLLSLVGQRQPNVVVTDILLPDINGPDLLQALNTVSARSFSLVVHSYAGEGHDLRRRGVDVFLARPANADDLVQAVRIASQRRRNAGRLALLVCPNPIDRRLRPALVDAGHTPIVVPTIEKAMERLGSYSVDIVIIARDVLGEGWDDLSQLTDSAQPQTRFILLSEKIRKADRKQAEVYGVELVQYSPGQEEDVLAAILAPTPV
jgi:DNA-binding response OmpR family regulator